MARQRDMHVRNLLSRVPGGPRRGSRRTLVLYLIAIVGPTLVLLFFGLDSLRQQRRAVVRFAEANRLLAERSVAEALERRVLADATRCLHDALIERALERRQWATPEDIRNTRLSLAEIAVRHPVARNLFVLERGEMRVPRVGVQTPQLPEDLTRGEPTGTAKALSELIEHGERLEAAGRFPDALHVYRAIGEQSHTPVLAALVVSRTARCLEHLGRTADAIAAYSDLAVRYRTIYDLSGRPYAFDAAIALARLQPGRGARAALLLGSLQAALGDGACELTPDEADHLTSVAGMKARPNGTPYLRYLQSARVLSETLRSYAAPPVGAVVPVATTGDTATARQFFVLRRPDEVIVAVDVDLHRVVDVTFPDVVRDANASVPLALVGGNQPGTPLRAAFGFWRVQAAPPVDQGLSGPRPALVAVGTALVLGVLLLSVALLVRDISRQAAANLVRAEFVAGVSHDLKTPLSVIKLYGETLAGDPDADRESRSSYYDVIVQESQRLTALIDRVLDFSRIEGGAREYRFRTGSVGEVVEQVLDTYLPHIRSLGFTVDRQLEKDVPAVRFDEGALSQAVLNLLDNAVKYSEEDRRVAVRVARRGQNVVISVEDHGIGIAEADRDRIFARFSRGSRSLRRGSHGLGLYLVKHMADAHGATIEVESRVGCGSVFSLVFPAAGASEPAAG